MYQNAILIVSGSIYTYAVIHGCDTSRRDLSFVVLEVLLFISICLCVVFLFVNSLAIQI